MGCGCCEETEHNHEHCGKEMECKDGKYVCVECGFTEECDCGNETEETAETKDDSDSLDESGE